MQFHFHANQSYFHKNGFETEAQGNSEMAYYVYIYKSSKRTRNKVLAAEQAIINHGFFLYY